jgi:hypothetical protein
MFRYIPYSSSIGFEMTESAGEERFRTLSIHAGRTTFNVPLATEELEAFNAFAKVVGNKA